MRPRTRARLHALQRWLDEAVEEWSQRAESVIAALWLGMLAVLWARPEHLWVRAVVVVGLACGPAALARWSRRHDRSRRQRADAHRGVASGPGSAPSGITPGTTAAPHVGRALAVWAALVVAGSLVAATRLVPLWSDAVADLLAHRAVNEVEFVITAESRTFAGRTSGPRVMPDTTLTDVRVEQVTTGGVVMHMRLPAVLRSSSPQGADHGALVPGSRWSTSAAWSAPTSRLGVATLDERSPPIPVAPAPAWRSAAHAIRVGLQRSLSSSPWPSGAGLVGGLAVGDEAGIDAKLRQDLKDSGLSHLTAVSGANVAILVGAVLAVCSVVARAGSSGSGLAAGRVGVLISAATLGGYVLVTGAEPSVVRATAMGALALVAMWRGSVVQGRRILVAAAFLCLLIDPWLATSPGFALSVFATAALIAVAGRQAGSGGGGARAWLVTAAVATAAAQVATLPIVASFGSGIPLTSVPANLLAEPAVPLVTIGGIVAALLSPVLPHLAAWVATASSLPAQWIALTASFWAQVPPVPWPSGLAGAGLALPPSGFALWWLLRGRERATQLSDRVVRFAPVLVALLVVLWSVKQLGLGQTRLPSDWLVIACDIGQGDAALIRSGPSSAVLVDAGPEPDALDHCISRSGVQAIDVVFLSHFHADHVGGLDAVLDGSGTGQIIASPVLEPAEQVAAVTAAAARRNVPLRYASAGERGGVGWVSWQILWPSRVIRSGSVPNNASLSMRLAIARDAAVTTVFVGGDVEPEAQAAVMGSAPSLDVDVAKVPHHGSANQNPRFASWLGAELGWVSAGRDNDYGHPTSSALNNWALAGTEVGRTDQDGDLVLVRREGRLMMLKLAS